MIDAGAIAIHKLLHVAPLKGLKPWLFIQLHGTVANPCNYHLCRWFKITFQQYSSTDPNLSDTVGFEWHGGDVSDMVEIIRNFCIGPFLGPSLNSQGIRNTANYK